MAEMAKGKPHPVETALEPPRLFHLTGAKGPFAIALDRSGKLHFASPDVGGDPVVILLGPDVSDAHLAELVADGISYILAADSGMAIAPLMEILKRELGIETLLLEGGGSINGSFFTAGVVDELYIVLTPTLDGSPSPSIVEAGYDGLQGKVQLSLLDCEQAGPSVVRLRYAVSPARA